jgi:hypothetical protein
MLGRSVVLILTMPVTSCPGVKILLFFAGAVPSRMWPSKWMGAIERLMACIFLQVCVVCVASLQDLCKGNTNTTTRSSPHLATRLHVWLIRSESIGYASRVRASEANSLGDIAGDIAGDISCDISSAGESKPTAYEPTTAPTTSDVICTTCIAKVSAVVLVIQRCGDLSRHIQTSS